MRVLGLISGTSHDGIDAAIVDFAVDGGDGTLHGMVTHTASTPYEPALRARLAAALPPAQVTLAEVTVLDTLIGQAFAEAAHTAVEQDAPVDLIVSHGQTVFHWVDGGTARGTLQIGQPAWIAERTGTAVLSDVRIRDITVGGHGAPLVSILDALLLGGLGDAPAALNLGGIANVTVSSADGVHAYDVGPANALIDAVVTEHGLHPQGYDDGGRIAASGTADPALLEVLLDEEYYRLAPPKSTGKELFHLGYVHDAVRRAGTDPAPADLVATLTELTVRTVVDALRGEKADALVVSGGGARNPVIMAGLRRDLPDTRVLLSDELGVPADAKEAIAFALIGWCSAHGLPGTVPGGTGAREPRILGTFTPGAAPLRLPAPRAQAPTSLRVHGHAAGPGRATGTGRAAGAGGAGGASA
ncbi:anhydro-N-acetylmuramic acid kinase [Phytoactinopolyspora halotolerans]|uniref:Anhydro-N-acetylmuramic acid kinase n=1 Tax=Phytoactinopolyspora halotolerans TaxID=1981512 RepID=A0A6L9SHL0_9ACTN|nr:anhydro-N-acetylmuramic acid kinase [Phytoactinopolyspora halotolerans]NEE04736.1 anhydro-N-acetylmuramic acid kinase [Phytoactinopolyspora halotolerans]